MELYRKMDKKMETTVEGLGIRARDVAPTVESQTEKNMQNGN